MLLEIIGGILAVLLSALLASVGWAIRRQLAFNRDIRADLDEIKSRLAVLVAEATNDREDIGELREVVEVNTGKQNELATSVALLADRLNRHERWAQDEYARTRDLPPRNPRTPQRREAAR